MAFIESGAFCRREEYSNGLIRRIHETQLQNGELYMIMMSLDGEKREAAKKAARLLEIAPKTGLAVVKFAFLSNELAPELEMTQTVEDGLINDSKNILMVDTTLQEKFPVAQAYFKDYFDDQFGNVLAESSSLSLVI